MAWSSVVHRIESVSRMVGSSKLHRVRTGKEKGKQYHIVYESIHGVIISLLLAPFVGIPQSLWHVASASPKVRSRNSKTCYPLMVFDVSVLQARADDDRAGLVCTLTKSSIRRHRHKFVFLLLRF